MNVKETETYLVLKYGSMTAMQRAWLTNEMNEADDKIATKYFRQFLKKQIKPVDKLK